MYLAYSCGKSLSLCFRQYFIKTNILFFFFLFVLGAQVIVAGKAFWFLLSSAQSLCLITLERYFWQFK